MIHRGGEVTMAAIRGYGDRRRTMRERLNSTFVEPDEFLRLLLSRRVLVRSDRQEGNIRGLLDPITGRRFVIERERLLQR